MAETNQLLKTIQETKSDGLSTLMESLDDFTFSKYLTPKKILTKCLLLVGTIVPVTLESV